MSLFTLLALILTPTLQPSHFCFTHAQGNAPRIKTPSAPAPPAPPGVTPAASFRVATWRNPATISCEQRHSCAVEGSAVGGLDPTEELRHINAANCLCDELCAVYHDCCTDYTPGGQPGGSGGPALPEPLPREVVACRYLGICYRDPLRSKYFVVDKHDRTVSAVRGCPPTAGPRVASLCAQAGNVSADPFLLLPVNDRQTRLLYANLYCALCNGVTHERVIYWTAEKDVDVGGTGAEERGAGGVSQTVCEGQVVFSYPPGLRPRMCKDAVHECAEGSTVHEQLLCAAGGASYVYTWDEQAYQNEHCAACNDIAPDRLLCEQPLQGEFDDLQHKLPSYSLLLDLNGGGRGAVRDNVVGGAGAGGVITKEETFEQRCPGVQVYDPFSDLCRPGYCRGGSNLAQGGWDLTDEGCEGRSEAEREDRGPAASTDLDGGISGCPLVIALNQSEYETLPNDVIYVPLYSRRYDRHEYWQRHGADLGSEGGQGPQGGQGQLGGQGSEDLRSPQGVVYVCAPFAWSSVYNVTMNVTETLHMFKFDRVQGILSFVGVILSLVGLLLQFVVYMSFPILRNVPGQCVMCLIVALFIGQLLFLFVEPRDWTALAACYASGVVMHYAFLAAFCWMNVMAIDICQTFSSETIRSSSSRRFTIYSLYAWLAPALIVGLAVTLDLSLAPPSPPSLPSNASFPSDFLPAEDDAPPASPWTPGYGEGLCWITRRTALLAYFAAPLCVVLLMNVGLLAATVCFIQRATHASQPAAKSESSSRLFLYIKLSLVMGLAWVFGFLAALCDWPALWYVFIIFNSLQGALLCLSFVCTARVSRLLRDACRGSASQTSGGTAPRTTGTRLGAGSTSTSGRGGKGGVKSTSGGV